MNNKMEISTFSIIKIVLVVAGSFILWYIRDILVMIFVVLVIVAALGPLAKEIEDHRVPRFLAVFLLYLVLTLILGLIVYIVIPPLVAQIGELGSTLPYYFNKLNIFYHAFFSTNTWQDLVNFLTSQLGKISQGVFAATITIFGGIAAFVTILVLSFYLLLENKQAENGLMALVPTKFQNTVWDLGKKIALKIGAWLRGQVVLSITVGIVDFVGLLILGVPYALTLGVLAAILEIVPIIGPFLAGSAAVFVAVVTVGWVKGLMVVALYIIVQQIEAHFLVPKIMGKAIGLSPAIIIIVLLVGAKLAGLVGAILAIPIAAAISVVFQEYQKSKS